MVDWPAWSLNVPRASAEPAPSDDQGPCQKDNNGRDRRLSHQLATLLSSQEGQSALVSSNLNNTLPIIAHLFREFSAVLQIPNHSVIRLENGSALAGAPSLTRRNNQ